MRSLALMLLLALAAGCEEAPPPAPEVSEPEPEPEPVSPPELAAIEEPAAGEAKVAVPTLGRGFEFPVQTLEAGFGRDETMVLVELKPDGGASLSVQITFHQGTPATGEHPLAESPAEGAVTAALGRTQLRLEGGSVRLDALEDQRLTGSFDFEVREPRTPEPTRLRGRFDATRHRYYDGVIEHQRAIRDQLRDRN